jgi:chloramphenicol 3-O phosphotransferase
VLKGTGSRMGMPSASVPGTIILLNGVSSAGKTSLARALLDVLDGPYGHVSIDAFEGMARQRLALPDAQDFYAACLIPLLHGSAAAFAAAGVGVVVDTILTADSWIDDAAWRFAPFRTLFVGVHCAPAELRRRERVRRDRGGGRAEARLPLVHPLIQTRGGYDLDVDTTTVAPEVCARQIAHHLATGPAPNALHRFQPRR